MQGPRILAGFVQSSLAALEPGLQERVRARLAPATIEALATRSRLAWLPVEIDVELTHAIYAELGPGRARELFRRNLAGAFEAPILHSLTQGALRLFGASPERLLRWAPKAYGQLYRDAGSMRFELESAGSARLELWQLPPSIAASRDYLDGMAGAIAAVFDLLKCKGEVRVERADARAGTASFRLSWDEDEDPLESLPEPAGA